MVARRWWRGAAGEGCGEWHAGRSEFDDVKGRGRELTVNGGRGRELTVRVADGRGAGG